MTVHGVQAAGMWLLLQEGHGPILALLLFELLALSVLTLAILGAISPSEVVRIHARFGRAMARMLMGTDWQRGLEAVGQKKYAEYLRRAPDEPDAFPSRVLAVRLVFALFMIVGLAMLIIPALLVAPQL